MILTAYFRLKCVKTTLTFGLILFLVSNFQKIHAQGFFPVKDFWKQSKYELLIGAGTANYYGDVGGADRAEAFALSHLEPKRFRTNMHLGLRYSFHQYFSVSGNFSYLRISGSDEDTEYELRRARNLSFQTDIYELAGRFEFHLIRPRVGHFNRVKWNDITKFKLWDVVLFAGVGTFLYTPKTTFDERTVLLRPLSTEGQGLAGGPDPYGLFAISFPAGISISYYLGYRTMLGFEVNYRITTSDYIDDVSGVYFNKDVIRENKGDLAAELSNRALPDADPIWTVPGAIRGNPDNNDTFFSINVTLTTSLIHNEEFRKKIKKSLSRKKSGGIPF